MTPAVAVVCRTSLEYLAVAQLIAVKREDCDLGLQPGSLAVGRACINRNLECAILYVKEVSALETSHVLDAHELQDLPKNSASSCSCIPKAREARCAIKHGNEASVLDNTGNPYHPGVSLAPCEHWGQDQVADAHKARLKQWDEKAM